MSAYQQTHASARSMCFLSQTPQVSHKLDAVRASINNVSCLYQVCDSADPVAVVIYSAAANRGVEAQSAHRGHINLAKETHVSWSDSSAFCQSPCRSATATSGVAGTSVRLSAGIDRSAAVSPVERDLEAKAATAAARSNGTTQFLLSVVVVLEPLTCIQLCAKGCVQARRQPGALCSPLLKTRAARVPRLDLVCAHIFGNLSCGAECMGVGE